MIEISKNGFIVFKENAIGDSHILTMLPQDVKLDSEFTLRSFFMMLTHYPTLAKINPYSSDYLEVFNSLSEQILDLQPSNNTLIFNSFLISHPPIEYARKFNIVVKSEAKKDYKITGFHLSELINCPFKLNYKAYPVDFENGIPVKYNPPLDVQTPCSLFEFIDAVCQALFRNMLPESRSQMVKLSSKVAEVLADDILSDITSLIEN